MSSKSDIAVSVRGLSKSYTISHQGEKHSTLAETLLAKARHPFKRTPKETFWALKDVNFDIKKGEVVGIIGRNGAGKSTLLKILSRITEPTAGQIDLYGRVGSLLEVGTGFHPELTGRENIFLNGAILGMTKAEIRKQFDAIVDFAGVEKFLDTPVKRYSSGMYVRLAFAVAAHLQSEILIVDEVLAVGDAAFQDKCLKKMRDLTKSGCTVLLVSHNMTQVCSIASRVARLQNGSCVGYGGTVEQVELFLKEAHTEPREDFYRLLPDIDCLGIEATPNPVATGKNVELVVRVRAKVETRLDDLCVIVCAGMDTRVAIADVFADREEPVPLAAGMGREFKVTVGPINLVERAYSIGLFARSPAGYTTKFGLGSVEVVGQIVRSSSIHGPDNRGFVELPFVSTFR